ncbi:hypothetical protein [Saccharopolyspora sp. ASAGF58]|uniref:hypothetical protein n=1 Tax=Saccharopolyspora sp. ASAGF58 TaxID=2719023 RepID=UPI00144003C7|nr:hypothetical protein [Saccharopolyspora sp. ASAGF58]QIZ37883.1 hypothetical protein FDZ84_29080 [Saccharopolyspora sp. ASAGF58]
MLRRGNRGSARRAAGTDMTVGDQPVRGVGVRQVISRHRETQRCYRIDPAAFACPTMVGQLADEWVAYARAMALADAARYAAAIRGFGAFVADAAHGAGLDPTLARLEDGPVDLTEALHGWELSLQQRYGPTSSRPYELVNAILTLIAHRGARGAAVSEPLRARAAGRPLSGRGAIVPLDEFSNAERLRLRRWARADVTALEDRLARGRALLAQGVDPRLGGWSQPANLVWAARHGLLNTQALAAELPAKVTAWPPALRAMLPAGTGTYHGRYGLLMTVAGLLFPSETDLQPFRVLLLLATSRITPEELHDLRLDDIEFTDGGVRLLQRKARAGRHRVRLHRDTPNLASPAAGGAPSAGQASSDSDEHGDGEGEPEIEAHRGHGRWDVPGLLRRLLATTATTREAFDAQPWLFLAVESRARRTMLGAAVARFKREPRRFTHWIVAHQHAEPPGPQPDASTTAAESADESPQPVISLPHDVRRLRKTAKTARVAALGGTLSDLAGDDHHVEVFRGHYAHGTTAHVLAASAINQAQDKVFRRAADHPVFLDTDVQDRLGSPNTAPDTAAEVGLTAEQATAIATGAADMGLTHCRDPYDSPHTPTSGVCHVAPAMCLLCPNAVVTTAQLPRLLRLAEHIDVQRTALDPRQWQALWGRQARALAELFAEIPDLIEAARHLPHRPEDELDLPLGMRTEYHR